MDGWNSHRMHPMLPDLSTRTWSVRHHVSAIQTARVLPLSKKMEVAIRSLILSSLWLIMRLIGLADLEIALWGLTLQSPLTWSVFIYSGNQVCLKDLDGNKSKLKISLFSFSKDIFF